VVEPYLHMSELSLAEPPPRTGEEVARFVADLLLSDIAHGRLRSLVLVTFRGATARMWQLHEVPQADEVIRAIAARDEATSLVVVHPAAIPPEVHADHAFLAAGEHEDDCYDLLIALRRRDGPGWAEVQLYGRHHTLPEPRWLGVATDLDLELREEGPVSPFGRRGEA
jgi:hypothetical protein